MQEYLILDHVSENLDVLAKAYELGCQFLSSGFNIADITAIYRDSLDIMILPVDRQDCINALKRSTRFLAESLLPFERSDVDLAPAEIALRESEEKFRQFAENIDDVFWITNPNNNNQVLYVSPAYAKIWSRPPEKLYASFDDFLESVHPEDCDRMNVLRSWLYTEKYDEEYRILRPNGEIRWIRGRAFPIRDQQGEIDRVIGISEDITDRKHAEAQIADSLQEKEVLLKEVHHRVKNNLQVVCSLLQMQARASNDPAVSALFTKSQNRVYSMALIHEKLYEPENLAQINFGAYLESLIHNLAQAYNLDTDRIRFQVKTDPIRLNISSAIPCGLIVNELVTNAIKHAFPAGNHGTICIECHEIEPNLCILNITDDGIGIPKNLDLKHCKSLGLRLVHILTKQLNASIDIFRENGTSFYMMFPNHPSN